MTKITKSFSNNEKGTVQTIFAITLVPLMWSVGAAVDYSSVSRLRSQSQFSADSALIAAATTVRNEGLLKGSKIERTQNKAVIEKRLKTVFTDFYASNMPANKRFKLYNDQTRVSYDPATGKSSVEIKNDYDPYIVDALTEIDMEVNTKAELILETKEHGSASSIYLVLDKSGSMGWRNRSDGVIKMTALKAAINAMHLSFEKADPDHELVRMGGNSYNNQSQGSISVGWGTTNTYNWVRSLKPNGGTDSSGAMRSAYYYMRGPNEESAHKLKHDIRAKKYIVFMTDGSNNRSSADRSTLATCNSAKKDGIEIYSVAFDAPLKGRNLLKSCASSESHYFDTSSTAELIAAFQEVGKTVEETMALSQ